MSSLRKETALKILSALLLLGAGFLAGWLAHRSNAAPLVQNVREASSDYKFISPLLLTKVPEDQAFPEYSALKSEVSDYVGKAVAAKQASDISVYFRNLNSDQWVAVNPDESFAPASMLKVITLIAVLRDAESDPELLAKSINLKGEDQGLIDNQLFFPAADPVRVGNTYTIQSLIDHMIMHSDNVANAALVSMLGDDKLLKVYDDLQLPRPDAVGSDGYTAREYSHLYRALYDSTYLSPSLSEQVLSLLGTTDFNDGIVAGVPAGTAVSHKFGEYAQTDANNDVAFRELHDCGIVYFPKDPYFICIMTRGNDFSQLEGEIKGISNLIWNDVSKVESKEASK